MLIISGYFPQIRTPTTSSGCRRSWRRSRRRGRGLRPLPRLRERRQDLRQPEEVVGVEICG